MATWAELDAELALWRAAGERPTFWWRDDDTQAPTDALRRLIALTAKVGAPLHLAVIPKGTDPELTPFLEAAPHVWCMQHGLVHKNHEPKGARASEIGQNRAIEASQEDLQTGWQLLQAAQLPNLVPILAPPWNRIGDKLIPHLADWGYRGLSCFGPRSTPVPKGPLQIFDGQVEPLRWRPDALFAGEEKTLAQCLDHLRDRRTGVVPKDAPTGLVTHHLQTPDAAWNFCDALAARLAHQGDAEWIALAPRLDPL